MSGESFTYTNCKDSGVDWIDTVPEHWQLLPARVAVTDLTEKNEGARNQDYLSLVAGKGVIPYADKGDMGNKKPDDLCKCKIVRKGNIVINSMNFFIGSYGMSDYRGVCSPVYIVLDVNQSAMEPRFALRVFGDTGFQLYLATFGNGILKHRAAIGWDDIKGTYLPVPPLSEQTQIAKFLDYETAKIDALIEKQQQLIALLKEKRQAVISHAVTKGLNPDAPMRDSGVEWLGEVPEHWEVVKLNMVTEIGNGSTPDRSTPQFWGDTGDFPWLNSSVVNQIAVHESDQFVTESALRKCHLPCIQPPAVLVGITGQGKTRGMATILKIVATINQHIAYIQPRHSRVTVPFIHRFFQMAYDHIRFESDGAGSTKGAITCGQLQNTKIPLPPHHEQIQISDHLCEFTAKIAELIRNAEEANDLLQERRTALISAAVTGKIDVREWTPSDELAEVEAA